MTPRSSHVALVLILTAGCAARTTPVTQPVPADYDPSKNDPKAIAAIDAMVAALGGDAAWAAAKEIRWKLSVTASGELVALYEHAWDRWNARHRFESTNLQSMKEAEHDNDPSKLKVTIGMYKLFERDRGAAMQNGQNLASSERKDLIANAFKRWQYEGYLLTFPFRLKDPGTYLSFEGENHDKYCPNICDVVKATIHPDMQGEVSAYTVHIDRASHKPVLMELQLHDGRMGYELKTWTTAAGLQLPTEFDNIGARDAGTPEVWSFTNVVVSAEPDDMLYIPRVL